MLVHAPLIALLTTTALASSNTTPHLSPAMRALNSRAPAVDCTDPSSFTCSDCFGTGFEACPDWEMMCYHPELVDQELGCLHPDDPDFDEKMDRLSEELGEYKDGELGDVIDEVQDKVDEVIDGEKGEDKEDDEKEGGAAGLGPRGYLTGAVVGAGVVMVVM